MNPKKYAEELIVAIKDLMPTDDTYNWTIAIKSGYPDPNWSGIGFGAYTQEGAERNAKFFQQIFAELIENIARDCIGRVNEIDELDKAYKDVVSKVLREHFELDRN